MSDSSEGCLLKQTLMSHDECFVYKVPPLATASGYRANDWNLAEPIETCGFQIERRNNDLYLLFTMSNHTKLFALSKIEGNNHNVETVMDSSRYFVCKILKSSEGVTKTALLGFGFRDRDIAIDLLANLQQFRQSIDRELEAKELASKTKAIPTLGQGEKIHVRIPGSKGKTTTVKSPSTTSKPSVGRPILLKKPPKGADEPAVATAEDLEPPMTPFAEGKRFSLSHMECPMTSLNLGKKGRAMSFDDDDSAAAHATNTVMSDDLDSIDEDLREEASKDDEIPSDESEGAVGGMTVNDDDGSSNDSFQFSGLNLDLDEAASADDVVEEDKNETAAEASGDEDFGDFQEA